MSKKDDKKSKKENENLDHHEAESQDDEMLSFVPGSNIIDIGELRRSQNNEDIDLGDEEASELEASALVDKTDDEDDRSLNEDEIAQIKARAANFKADDLALEDNDSGSDADMNVSPEETSSDELSLDDQARLLRQELDNDPELKKDVLADFDGHESNENLERIASAVTQQELNQIEEMEALAHEVADELKELNNIFIAEDQVLEANNAREAVLQAGIESEEVETEEMSEQDQELKAALPQANEDGQYNLDDLQSCIEALLFYSDRPVSLKKLKEMLEMVEAEDEPLLQAIELLKASYQTNAHGFEVAEIAGGYQLRTKPSKAPLLRKLAKVQVQRLSRGAMETLTIVAYKQPCTKDDIDQVRGVDSSHFIRTLLDRKLIEISGRSEAAGRPMIYQTTDTFLEVFGMMDLKGIPPLREIEAMVPQMAASEEGAEDPRVIQMRKMVHQMKVESNHLDYDSKEDEKILKEIRDRVKSIDITTPYLARQKELAEQGIQGEEAEAILAKEFGFDRAEAGGEPIAEEPAQTELSLDEARPPLMSDNDIEPQADQIDSSEN